MIHNLHNLKYIFLYELVSTQDILYLLFNISDATEFPSGTVTSLEIKPCTPKSKWDMPVNCYIHSCNACGKTFKQLCHLKEHSAVHLKPSNVMLKCSHCKKRFRHRRSLRRHIKSCQGLYFILS